MRYECDGCGRPLDKRGLRYTVTIDVRAVYEQEEVGLLELVRDHRAELLALIEQMKDKRPEELEETVYKSLKLDLCPTCQKAFIRDPLRFHPEQGADESDIDIDGFLRSLGYGKKPPRDDDEDKHDSPNE